MVNLSIFVARHCPISVFSRQLAREVEHLFPSVHVAVIDVEEIGHLEVEYPSDVLLTPCYTLGGRLISLGNPDRDELFALLDEALLIEAEGEIQ